MNFTGEKTYSLSLCQAWMLMHFISGSMFSVRRDKAEAGNALFSCPPSFYMVLSNFLNHDCFSLRKSRTVGRTRCDCFHTQEVITPDLPQLWLRLINIDEQLMRCHVGARLFPSCLPMTPMERKNDLDSAMSWPSFISAKHKLLIILSWWVKLSMLQPDYSRQRNSGLQMFVGMLFFIITLAKLRIIIANFHSILCSKGSRFRQTCSEQKAPASRSISWLKDYLKCLSPIDCAAHTSRCQSLSLKSKINKPMQLIKLK